MKPVRHARHARVVAARVRGTARRRLASTAVATLVTLVSGGAALGYVTVTGEGTGQATATNAPTQRLVAALPGSSGIYPGGPAVPVPLTLLNRWTRPLTITHVTADLSGLPSSCAAAHWSVAGPASLPTIAPTSSGTVTLSVSLLSSAPEECAGTEFAVPVTAEGEIQ